MLMIARGLKIVASKLADDAAIFGGIALAEEFLGVRVELNSRSIYSRIKLTSSPLFYF